MKVDESGLTLMTVDESEWKFMKDFESVDESGLKWQTDWQTD